MYSLPPHITLSETSTSEYAPRTIQNAEAADLTLYFHAPGEGASPGRILTEKHSKFLIPIRAFDDSVAEVANKVLNHLHSVPLPIVNIAGNRQHKFGTGRSQADVTRYIVDVMSAVTSMKKISQFRTGGQTGADWGGLIAGVVLNVGTIALFPAGFKQQYTNRKNIPHTRDEIVDKIEGSVKLLTVDPFQL